MARRVGESRARVLVVGEDRTLAEGLRSRYPGLRVELRSPARASGTSRPPQTPDLVVWDGRSLGRQHSDLPLRWRERRPRTRMLLLEGPGIAVDQGLQDLFQAPGVDFVRSPLDWRELALRIHRLLAGGEAQPAASLGVPSPSAPGLRHPGSGRLDARRVSAWFGLPLAALARISGRSPQAVSKTPDAPTLQKPLRAFEVVASGLERLVGSEAGARIWLNTPNPDLAGRTPLSLLSQGEGQVVADLVEDLLVGQPG